MSHAQFHRGPDDGGLYQDDRVVLGHRRLSIIDTSPGGRQPMQNEDGSVWVICNGEIYNYQELSNELVGFGHAFRSRSDTEVILHGYEQWGIEGLLAKLRGMFGFALYDSRVGSLFLARDRLGIKPLYYCESQGQPYIAFASEVKALLAGGLAAKEWDTDALIGFLLFGSVPSPLTAFRNVRSVLPGYYMVVGSRGSATHKFWDLHSLIGRQMPEGDGQIIQLLRQSLFDAVLRHLISDVPLGLFLSGGMDSVGLLAVIARERAKPLTTLTVAFDEKELSEAELAGEIARHFGADHREVLLKGEDFTAELPKFFACMDQPTIDGLNTYFISKAARCAGLTVVLSGLGGDEAFWGYRHYQWFRKVGTARLLAHLPFFVRRALLMSGVAYGRITGQEQWLRLRALGSGISNEGLYFVARGLFAPEQVSRLLGLDSCRVTRALESFLDDGSGRQESMLDPSLFNCLEVKRYLHDQLLRDTDVFSMAHSIETRVPYLDHGLLSLAMQLGSSRKLRRGINKPMLASVLNEPLVWNSARQVKRTFTLPLHQWIRNSLDEMLDVPLKTDLLEKHAVGEFLERFRARRLHWSRVWSLIVLGAYAARSQAG